MTFDTHTTLCAVIGNPVEHSMSPAIHNAAYAAAALNYVYLAFRVEDVAGCLAGMRAMPNFRGMSVTIPHKLAVMKHLDDIDPMAEHVGSVNTITNEHGRLIGSTTDGPGAMRAFEDAGVSLDGERILLTGSGGAVRAVAFAAAEMAKPAHMTILGIVPEERDVLARDLERKTGIRPATGELQSEIETHMADHDIVIQGTPLGMHPDTDGTCIPKELLRPEQTIFDIVYNPIETRLLREAKEAGCTTISGVEMFVNQAVLQHERWTGQPAPVDAMRDALLTAMGAK